MEPTSQKNSEEIDIISLLNPIGEILKKLTYKLSKNWLTVAGIVLFFVSIGYSFRFLLPKQYETNAIIHTNEIPAEVCILALQNLNQLISNREDFSLLAKQLHINNKYAEAIKRISAEKIKDADFAESKDSTGQFITISLRITNSAILDSVQAGIVYFLENNEYARIRKESKRASLHQLKLNLEKNIESLDSLKSVVNNSIIPRGYGQGIIFGEPIDPVSIYYAEIAYFKEQLKMNEALATLDNIEIIQSFTEVKKSNYPDFNRIALYSFLCGLVFAIAFVLLFKKER